MKYILQKKVSITPASPFAFDSTFHKPDHFTSGDNKWEPGMRWQTWIWQGKPLGIKFINKGSIEDPLLQIEIYYSKSLDEEYIQSLIHEIRYRFNLDLDLSDFYKSFEKDTVLAPIIKKWRGLRPGHPSSLYEYLIIGIVLQNATVRRSVQMFKSLLEKYGIQVKFDGESLWSFWEPGKLQSIGEDELRSLKVGYRAKSIKKIDEQFTKGNMNEFTMRNFPVDQQMEELLKLYGVGPATVWYLLFDVFHHWDYFNHISPWEQKIYSKLFFDKDPEAPVSVERLLKYLERYGKYKHLAVHYIWEDLWWKRQHEQIPWLEKEIRL